VNNHNNDYQQFDKYLEKDRELRSKQISELLDIEIKKFYCRNLFILISVFALCGLLTLRLSTYGPYIQNMYHILTSHLF